MKRERTAALSAVSLMLIAGCSGGGGRSAGTMTPSLPGGGAGQTGALTSPPNATLQIAIPPPQQGPQGIGRRTTGARYAANARRHPSWISGFSSSGTLTVVPTNGGPTFTTSISFSSCAVGVNYTTYMSYYNCPVNVPSGSNVFYLSIYDTYGNLLSTNQYANPAAQTVNANGSASSNTISIFEQGVVRSIQQESAVNCFSAGHPQAVYFMFKDADGTPIFGPLANPITPTFTSYDGAGLGALAPYAIYMGGSYTAYSVNNTTLYDTSMYFPYLWVSGQEGAINVAATVQNIPVYTYGTYATLTPTSRTPFATGTYTAWGIGAGGNDIYPIAVQTTLNQAVVCDSANGTFQSWGYIGAILDPTNANPYLVANDTNNDLYVFDAYVTANASRSMIYFNPYTNYGPSSAGLQFNLAEPLVFTGSVFGNNLIDFFTSSVVPGRIDVLSTSTTPGHIDLIDITHGAYGPTSDLGTHSFTTGVALYGGTRLAGSTVSGYLYYNDPGTQYVYSEYVPTSASAPTILNNTTPFNGGQVYAIAPSGPSGTYIFERGVASTGQFYICAFDSNPAVGPSTYCHTTGSYNANAASLSFDPGSGALMFAGGYTGSTSSVYALPANQAPSTWSANPFGSAPFYALQSATYRFTPTVATPGIVGLWGTQTTGPCAGSGEVTWLSYSGGAFHYIASVCWPNHYITLTYP